jgi:hypothetical protein
VLSRVDQFERDNGDARGQVGRILAGLDRAAEASALKLGAEVGQKIFGERGILDGWIKTLMERFPYPGNTANVPFLPPDQRDPLLQSILAGEAAAKANRPAAVGGAIGMVEAELASLREGRGGSFFAPSDTRRGITGIRSIGGDGGPSAREQQLEKTLQKLQEELKKLNGPDPIQEESLRVLKEMNARLDPESQL